MLTPLQWHWRTGPPYSTLETRQAIFQMTLTSSRIPHHLVTVVLELRAASLFQVDLLENGSNRTRRNSTISRPTRRNITDLIAQKCSTLTNTLIELATLIATRTETRSQNVLHPTVVRRQSGRRTIPGLTVRRTSTRGTRSGLG